MRTLLSKSIMTLIVGVALTPALGGCESRQYEVASNPDPVTSMPADTTVPPASTSQFPLPSDRELRVMTTKLSGGAVEIYDLEGPGAGGYSSIGSVQTPSGVPLASDPRVTVYPLDGGEFDAGVYGGTSFYQQQPVPISPYEQSGLPIGSHVYFEHGSANVTGSGKRVVSDAAETAKFAPLDRVSVEGHASSRVQTSDPIRGRILNLKESMNRAFEVSKDLIEQGVPAEKIKTVGWGDTKDADGNEAHQRRVDIVTGQ